MDINLKKKLESIYIYIYIYICVCVCEDFRCKNFSSKISIFIKLVYLGSVISL